MRAIEGERPAPRRLRAVVVMLLAASCSLLVSFDDESQLCDSFGRCLPNFACSDAGLCVRTDGGFASDAGKPDGGTGGGRGAGGGASGGGAGGGHGGGGG